MAGSIRGMSKPETTDRPVWLFGRTELIIVILLGLVSLATAYTSFEASLYDGNARQNDCVTPC